MRDCNSRYTHSDCPDIVPGPPSGIVKGESLQSSIYNRLSGIPVYFKSNATSHFFCFSSKDLSSFTTPPCYALSAFFLCLASLRPNACGKGHNGSALAFLRQTAAATPTTISVFLWQPADCKRHVLSILFYFFNHIIDTTIARGLPFLFSLL